MRKLVLFCFLIITFFLTFGFLLPRILLKASATGSWNYTGSIQVPRIDIRATTLQNGKVLIVGGFTSTGDVLDSELFDPITGIWSSAGNIPLGVNRHRVVLLQDGKALVIGGQSVGDLYDPINNTWLSKDSVFNHEWGTATVLNNGKVLIAGGIDSDQTDVYDPTTGIFSSGNNMTTSRSFHVAVLLQNGKVLIAGGQMLGSTLSSAEIYDPDTGQFDAVASMNIPRTGFAGTLLPDGRVLVAGGGSTESITTAEIYDPALNTWTMTGNLQVPRFFYQQDLIPLADGTILAVGNSSPPGTSETYNPQTGTWSNLKNMQVPQCSSALTRLTDGRALIVGENDCFTGSPISTAQIYDSQNDNPIITSISPSSNTTQVNAPLIVSASFTDANVADTHTATWDWGDGSNASGTITETNGAGNVSDSHTYVSTGIYPITLKLVDSHGGTISQTYQYIVVFDSTAGWVTGSKEFNSPPGAVTGNSGVTGKVNFGFQVKYSNGSMVPSGKNISFDFPTGNISFSSSSYQWLIVNGSKATFKANGTFNGISGFTMLASAKDQGSGNPSGLVRFQIKDSNNNVVYDTQPGAADLADPIVAVTKGQIAVH